MPTIMDFYNSGLTARQNQTRGKYLDPMLEAELYSQKTRNKYLDPSLAAKLFEMQTRNRFLPEALLLENQGQGLTNQHQGQVNQAYPELTRSTLESQRAANREKNFYADNPLLKLGGTAGQVGAALYLQGKENNGLGSPLMQRPDEMNKTINQPISLFSDNQNPNYSMTGQANEPLSGMAQPISGLSPNQNPNYSGVILDNLSTLNNVRNARANLDTVRANNYNWSQLPAETKNNLMAQGYGMGIDAVKMKNYVNSGLSLREIAEKEGLDPNNIPPPIYPPTTSTKTRVQQVEQVGAELDYLSSAVTPIIGRYADTFAGVSVARLKDMLSSDPEAQKRFGEYFGAISVQTGVANARVLLEGGKPGVQVMRMVKDSALQGIDQRSPIKMSQIAYTAAQKTIDRILKKGAKIRTMTGMNPFSEITNNTSTAATENNSPKATLRYNQETGEFEEIK